ncbi:MAG: protein clustered with O-phosphoseryl-tRNA(Cys) synthetase [Candidatus Methanoperedens sp.]|nr:protein clustered with O-phosphoseryl-tRNA(Cys) synthetase [Candidatus Methanoperedens sp.]
MLYRIPQLMGKGRPVSVLFTGEEGERSSLLYCELIQRARSGESFMIKNQGCKVGAYVLGETENAPVDYYFKSGRYDNTDAASRAVFTLHRLDLKQHSIKISPYSGGDFDVLILFLKPASAMRLIQACTYMKGKPVEFKTGGIASICSDCTACPAQGNTGISLGCKGSRKHSNYPDEELPVGIPSRLAGEIETALGKIPGTLS